MYDTRKLATTELVRAPGPLNAVAVHPAANIFAW